MLINDIKNCVVCGRELSEYGVGNGEDIKYIEDINLKCKYCVEYIEGYELK